MDKKRLLTWNPEHGIGWKWKLVGEYEGGNKYDVIEAHAREWWRRIEEGKCGCYNKVLAMSNIDTEDKFVGHEIHRFLTSNWPVRVVVDIGEPEPSPPAGNWL